MSERRTPGTSQDVRITVKTDKDKHFTTTIAQYAIDTETISDALPGQEVLIHSCSIVSDEQINYDVYIFSSASAVNSTDIDKDDTIDLFHLDLISNGKQIISAGAYRMSNRLENPIHLLNDKQNDNNLYIGLSPQNAAKTAGAAGELTLTLSVSPIPGGH